MLAMGRALMSKPRIVLMDEPSMGLSPIFVNEIFNIIQKISAEWNNRTSCRTECEKGSVYRRSSLCSWKQERSLMRRCKRTDE